MFDESQKLNNESLDKKQKNITASLVNSSASSNLINSLPPSKLILTSTKWSSNIRQNSQNSEDLHLKIDHKITKQLSVDACDFNNALKVTDTTERPLTSISLPSNVKNEKILTNKQKNPSCPSIPVTPKRIIVRSQSPISREESIQSELDSNDTNSDLNPITIVINGPKTNTNSNSNLDYFINLASNPFTTKYEIIGNKSLSPSPPSFLLDQSKNNLSDSKIPVRSNSALNLSSNKNEELKTDHIEVNFEQKLSKSVSDENLNKDYSQNTGSYTNFFKVTDLIYTGSMSCIKNERKMCKLNIEYLVDMSDMRPEDLNRQTLGKLPCLCKNPHSRITLSVGLTDKSFKTLFITFSEVNKLIQRAKRANKNVLIFGKEHLSPQVVCACAQYLMVDYQMDFSSALTSILNKEYKSKYFEKSYQIYLEQLEAYLKHLSSTNINLNLNYVSTKANKLNKAKIVYRPLNNEDDYEETNETNNRRINFRRSLDKNNLDYCNISDEEDNIQFNGRKKYAARIEFLSDSDSFRINSNKKTVSFSKLKKSTETNSASGSKMAWM